MAPLAMPSATVTATPSPRGSASPTPSPAPTATQSATPSPAPTGSSSGVTAASGARDGQTIDTIDAYYATLPHSNAASDAASLAAYMSSLPNVLTSGSSPYNAFAVMKDGLYYVAFLDQNQPGVQPGSMARLPSPASRVVRSAQSSGNYAMLPNGTAYVFSNSAAYGDVSPEMGIAKALRAAGYDAMYEEATIANFRSMSNASLFYLFDHSGIVSKAGQIPSTFAVGTSDQFNAKNIPPQYLPLLSSSQGGSVALGSVPQLFVGGFDVNGVRVHTYGVTTAFFEKQPSITFATGGLAFVNTCESAQADFIAALMSKGAGTFVGWPLESLQRDGRESGNFFIDRLLGEGNPSVLASYVGVPKPESPPERPFSLGEVASYAATFPRQDTSPWNVDTSCSLQNAPSFCTSLQYAGAMNVLLAPSISQLQVDESTSTVYVSGEYGSDPATLSVGTSPSDTTSFTVTPGYSSTGFLNATIPKSGSGSAGYVALSVNGIASNAVPLTLYGPVHVTQMWNVPTDVIGDQTINATGSAVANLYFRGDVHSMRDKPGATPTPLTFGDDEANSGSVLLPKTTSKAALALNYASQYSVAANGSGAQRYCAVGGSNCYSGGIEGCTARQSCMLSVQGSVNHLPQSVSPPCGNDPSCPLGPDGSCFGSPTCEWTFGYGAGGALTLGLDASYGIVASSGSSSTCSFDLDNFFYIYPSQLAGTCSYVLEATPATYPPLPTTAD